MPPAPLMVISLCSLQGVRTADDASLTVKVMVFFQITNLELMLNSTHDPIGDFIK